jgi:hypothetical protein
MTTIGVALAVALPARAEVTRVVISKRTAIAQSEYEKIAATVFFAVDPKDPHNAIVVDLDKAPRTPDGKVEFSSDLYIIRPKDPVRGNGSVLMEVPNRGERHALVDFNRAGPNPDPETQDDLGDNFLMRFGFTLAWVGWESDLDDPTLMRIRLPATAGRSVAPGLGFVAVRDVAAWFKRGADNGAAIRYAYGLGKSQTGRFLREFLYLGFNTDERDGPVFDGVMAYLAGASRIGLNAPGAAPSSRGVGAAAFPFADAKLRDVANGAEDGLLDNPRAGAHQPKVFYANTSHEYWGGGRVAALVHTTPDGTADLSLPDNVRFYFFAGTQHIPSRFPAAKSAGQAPDNAVDYWWVVRALLLAMHRWVSTGTPPPASAYPTLKDGTLVPAETVVFPGIPGVASPRQIRAERRGPNPLLSGGAGSGTLLPLLVPAVDEDGNERAGIRLPDVAVPLATYTGWNFKDDASSGAARGDLVPLTGSTIAFPVTRAARGKAEDPRRSIEERYASQDEYLKQVEQSAEALVLRGYLLIDDVPRIVQRASDTWDTIVSR